MEIRSLEKEDYSQILEIYNYYIECTSYTLEYDRLSLDEFSERLDKISKKYPFIVALEGKKVVGYAYLNEFSPRKGYMYTVDLSIYVDKDERRKGFGKAMGNEIIALAKKSGYKNIIAIITSKNQSSVEFHKMLGFVKVGEFPDVAEKFGETFGVTYLQLKLTEE